MANGKLSIVDLCVGVTKAFGLLSFETSTQDADLTEVMLDGTIVRSHACSSGYEKNSGAEQALGRSKGGFTTKIHAMVDALGNPLKFILTGGERHEIIAAEALIEDIQKAIFWLIRRMIVISFGKKLKNKTVNTQYHHEKIEQSHMNMTSIFILKGTLLSASLVN